MAYGYRSNYGRRRYRRSNRKYSKSKSRALARPKSGLERVAQSVGNLWKGYKRIKSLINVEWKKHDAAATGVSITENPLIIPLTLIAEGDDYDSRDGKSILAKSLTMNCVITHNASGNDEQVIRFVVIRDNDSREAAPTAADIVQSWNSLYIVDGSKHMKRFQIIADDEFRVGATASPYASIYHYKKYFKLNHHITFDDTTAAQDAAQLGHLYLIHCGSQASTDYPQLDYTIRTRFIDN